MIEVQEILAAAQQQTGLTNAGDERIMEGLNRLVDALNSEAKLSEWLSGKPKLAKASNFS